MIRILDYATAGEALYARPNAAVNVEAAVAEILAGVRARGDAALKEYTLRFDGVALETLEVGKEEMDALIETVEPEFLRVLKKAAANIRAFHSQQIRQSFLLNQRPGVLLGQKILPIEKVGLYVPGGTAAYPSTVLMDAIPAKLAGCKEIVMVTPPDKNGMLKPAIVAAARIAGVDRIFKIGGAQAVAALAYGTESVPRVDKIVGPGNAFVAEAKKQVFGQVSIDMIAGPSEILIVSDAGSDPEWLAADLLSQAEHDKMASAILVTPSRPLADRVAQAVEEQLCTLPRQEIARASIENNGRIVVTRDLSEAMDYANAMAPEHLELAVDQPFDLLDRVKHAGSVFLGRNCPEPLGDYLAGPNHTLPTSGTARFSSPLSVDDFVKKMQVSYYSTDAIREDAEDVAYFARMEGLDAHARSAMRRMEEKA